MREHEPDITELTPAEVEFAARMGQALRADASAPADFDAKVMEAIRADVGVRPPLTLEQGRPWWVRKRAFALSPLGGLALAAGFAGFVALGTLAVTRAPREATVAAAQVDTVNLVRFVIQLPNAKTVALVGDFNGWSRDAMPLEQSADGASWSLTVPLAPGRYEYAFVVDGQRWVADPSARAVKDEFGGETSILRLGSDRAM